MQPRTPHISPLPYRIRIGITGHRNELPDEKMLMEKLKEILSLDQFAHTEKISENTVMSLFDDKSIREIGKAKNTPIAYEMLSSLAEGADRLVAKVVLETSNGILTSVLPLTVEDYLLDFETKSSKDEFQALIGKANYSYYVQKDSLYQRYTLPEEGALLKQARITAYKKAGQFVVNNCDVLIAIIAPERKAESDAGTHAIVKYAEDKKRPVIKLIIKDKQIVRIESQKGLRLNASSIKLMEYYNTYTCLDDSASVYRDLFILKGKEKETDSVSAKTKQVVRDKLIPHYVKADDIANHHQRWYQWAGLLAYCLAVVAVVVIVAGLVVKPFYHWSYLIEFIVLTTALVMITVANKRGAHKNWVESRFLAERIRCAFFFAVNGCQMPRLKIPPYLGVPFKPTDWMIRCFDEIWLNVGKTDGCTTDNLKILAAYTKAALVQDQLNYHQQTARENKSPSERIELAGKIIFGVALSAALVHFILGQLYIAGKYELFLTALALILPPAAAALEGIRHHNEYSRNAKRSNSMHVSLLDLCEKFDAEMNVEEYHQLLLEVNDLMVRETQDWMMLMSTVKLEPVT